MAHSKTQVASTRDLKHRVLTCLNKLSDRDTRAAAASELESIAKTLTHDSIPPFLSSISATNASDKSPVRKQCVQLISLLSESHGDALSPYLSKLLSAVVRCLRDPDSAVRSACINATASISSQIKKPPFTSLIKPLIDALVIEQDQNSQIGAALCLAAAIDAAPEPDPIYLKKLLPRLEKLLKCKSFKAKPALLMVVGSAIEARAASTQETVRNLVPCLVEFVGREDWAARKAAAEALVKLALVEGDLLPEYKAACLKTFEARRCDKVKVVRETMNQLVAAWKEIVDFADESSPPPEQQLSSKDNASDGRYPPGSKASQAFTTGSTLMRKKYIQGNRSVLPDESVATPAKKSSLDTSDKKSGSAMFRKLDCKKTNDWKIEISSPHSPSMTVACEDDPGVRDEKGEKLRSKFMTLETRRALFNWNLDEKMLKLGGVNARSRAVQCDVDSSETTVTVSTGTENVHKDQKESDDLSLIRKQLVQIENQQSNLLGLLQNFVGSSQNGMHSLGTRVQGLELALNEISYDLALTNGRMSNMDSEGTTCCKLRGAEFLSLKFWNRTEPRTAGIRNLANKNGNSVISNLENRRIRDQSNGGFIMNPVAEIQRGSQGISEVSSNSVSKNVLSAS